MRFWSWTCNFMLMWVFFYSQRLRRKTHGFCCCSLKRFMYRTLWSCSTGVYVVIACWEPERFFYLPSSWWWLHSMCSINREYKIQTGTSTRPTYLFGIWLRCKVKNWNYYVKTNSCPVSFFSNKWPIVEVENNSPEGSVIQESRTDGQKIPRCHNRFMVPAQICLLSWRAETQTLPCVCVCFYECETRCHFVLKFRWK